MLFRSNNVDLSCPFLEDPFSTNSTNTNNETSSRFPLRSNRSINYHHPDSAPQTNTSDYIRSEADQEDILKKLEFVENQKKRWREGAATITPQLLEYSQSEYYYKYDDSTNRRLTTDRRPMRCRIYSKEAEEEMELKVSTRRQKEEILDTVECCYDSSCNCPRQVNEQRKLKKPWNNIEKCIFLEFHLNIYMG